MPPSPLYSSNDSERILATIRLGGREEKVGFVVYRCTYADDSRWKRFMERLTAWAIKGLDFDRDHGGEELKPMLDWDVREDPALEGASKDEVRRHVVCAPGVLCSDQLADSIDRRYHERIAAAGHSVTASPRYEHCVHVDAAALDSVLAAADPETSLEQSSASVAYVNLIDMQFAYNDPATYDWAASGKDPAVDDCNDQGYPPVDGCRLEGVGWMKVEAKYLVPRIYNLMSMGGWIGEYMRPPKMHDA